MISPELQSALNRKASMTYRHPDQDQTELCHEIAELRIRDAVEAATTEHPELLRDPARRARIMALLTDGTE
jgi:hypothetical protein